MREGHVPVSCVLADAFGGAMIFGFVDSEGPHAASATPIDSAMTFFTNASDYGDGAICAGVTGGGAPGKLASTTSGSVR